MEGTHVLHERRHDAASKVREYVEGRLHEPRVPRLHAGEDEGQQLRPRLVDVWNLASQLRQRVTNLRSTVQKRCGVPAERAPTHSETRVCAACSLKSIDSTCCCQHRLSTPSTKRELPYLL